MKLLENGTALEAVEDMISGEDPVDPGHLIDDGILESGPLTETDKKIRSENIRENRRSVESIKKYLQSSRNPSFTDYQNSSFFDESINQKSRFVRDVKILVQSGLIDPSTGAAALSASGSRAATINSSGQAAFTKGSSLASTYERPAEGTVKAEHLTGVQKKYELDKIDMNSAGTAEEIFDNMESAIRDVLTQESVTRHVLIFGDPG